MEAENDRRDTFMTDFVGLRGAIKSRDFAYLESNAHNPIHVEMGLVQAAILNAPEALAYFLGKGEDINDQPEEKKRNTPLMHAAVHGSVEAVRFLLEHSADPHLTNAVGETALDRAEGDRKHSAVAAFREIGMEPSLVYLAEHDYPALLERLRSPDVPFVNRWGRSVIPELILKKKYELAKRLLETRGGINTPGKEGITCLHGAIMRKKADLARHLLENGADPNCVGYEFFDEMPLILAINLRASALLPVLLEFGADVNVIDDYGSTPLIHAIRLPSAKYVQFLLDNGADPRIGRNPLGRDDAEVGKDAWETAKRYGNKQVVHVLDAYVPRLR
ncbi:MAG: ankyrin repeat domain-containing protein [Akkermansiaceae bacterium]|nr:ankyrin repeat domain-containing protein [Armatimonadota bacterium]